MIKHVVFGSVHMLAAGAYFVLRARLLLCVKNMAVCFLGTVVHLPTTWLSVQGQRQNLESFFFYPLSVVLS